MFCLSVTAFWLADDSASSAWLAAPPTSDSRALLPTGSAKVSVALVGSRTVEVHCLAQEHRQTRVQQWTARSIALQGAPAAEVAAASLRRLCNDATVAGPRLAARLPGQRDELRGQQGGHRLRGARAAALYGAPAMN